MTSDIASAVEDYLAPLPPERRAALVAVREVVLAHLPRGYVEVVAYGGICYCIPLERYPKTYNGRPLTIAALCARKSYLSFFYMPLFRDPVLGEWFRAEYRQTGKQLAMGRGCLRFKRADDLPLELIGRLIALVSPERYMSFFDAGGQCAPGERGR